MFQRLGAGLLGLCVLVLAVSGTALAHERHYVFTEEYQTLPRNVFEIENAATFKIPDRHVSNENQIEFRPELEYGVTDRLTVAHYQQWVRENHAGAEKDFTKYRGFKFEAKYRIAEKGKFWVDPLLYFEYERDPQDENPNILEEKIVLSKDFGKLNVTYNQIMESHLSEGGRTEHEYSLGMHYRVFDWVTLGYEAKGQYWNPGSNHNEIAMGPAVGIQTQWFWVAAGCLFGVNHHADDFQPRIIVGVPIG